MYYSESIMCEKLKKNISEIMAMDKNFHPYYKNDVTNENVFVRDIFKEFAYSLALSELFDLTYEQYKRIKGE